jgi:hypothetical protein
MVLAKLEHFMRQILLCEPRQRLSASLLRRIKPEVSIRLASAHQLWILAYHLAARADPVLGRQGQPSAGREWNVHRGQQPMQTCTAVTDQALADSIARARSRVVLVAPGLTEVVAGAIGTLSRAQPAPQVTPILNPDVADHKRLPPCIATKKKGLRFPVTP